MEIYLTSGLFSQFYSLEHTIVPVSIQAPCNHASITRLTIDYWVFFAHTLSEFFSNSLHWPNKRPRKIQIYQYKAEKGI